MDTLSQAEYEKGVNLERKIFYCVLEEIQSHIFITPDSLEYRDYLRGWMGKVRQNEELKEAVFFPVGSVAAGMVKEAQGSDVDGNIFYSCSEEQFPKIQELIFKIEPPEEYQPFFVFSRIDNYFEDLAEDMRSAIAVDSPYRLRGIAMLFAPSLSEQANRMERERVDGWRKKALSLINSLPEDQKKEAWELITRFLEQQFVHYEESEGGNTGKRKKRVDERIDEVVEQRFPGNGEKQKRAKSFIKTKRKSFKYLSFQEMKRAYNIV